MYLSKLEIIGFKSFAHKTVLKFDDGITAVVGPNGCGKSNVIDALRWSIGEQKASVLRSDKMENVIFNGAGKRRPLGMAEVSLTIENTKGILPTEYSEVTITRRLFRNGDSEYLLNKTQCRLRDIVDLFMDTGMGANAYSVIELKMIETILSDRADERRKLFEEAAGVTKYKVRRREALRKLDSTQQDLVRVNDIIKEVGKKVSSLERQAKKAEEFAKLDEERKRLEVEILEREYSATVGRISPLEVRLVEARSKKEALDTQLAEEEELLLELEAEHKEIEAALGEAQKDVNAISGRIAQVEQRRAVAEERRRSLNAVIERAERDRMEAEGGIEALAHDRKEIEEALIRIREQVEGAEFDLETMRSEVSSAEGEVNELRRQAKGSQERVIAAINRIAELRGEEERTRARMENISGRLSQFDDEDEEARSDRQRAEELQMEIEAEQAAAQIRLDRAQQEFEAGQEGKAQLRAEIDELRSRTQDLHNGINTRQSKIEFLSSLVDQDESVRFLVAQPDWSPVERITVSEALATDERFRLAVAAALGSAAHYLIVPTLEDAKRGMHSLASNRKGKVTFVCLDRIASAPSPATIDGPNVIGWAGDLCTSAPEHDALRRTLLNHTLIVETLEDATGVVSSGAAETAVTLDGLLVRAGGVIRGGGQMKNEGNTIGKREQIERLTREADELRAGLAELEERIARVTGQHNEINLGLLSDGIRKAQQELGQVEKRRAQVDYELEYAEDLLEEHAIEREKFEEELHRLGGLLEGTEPRRAELRAEQEQSERAARDLAVELERVEAGFAERAKLLNEVQLSLASFRNEERSAKVELERIRRDRENAERMIENRRVERERAQEELEVLEASMNEGGDQLESFKAELSEATIRRDQIVKQQAAKREEIVKHSETLREERKGYESAIGQTHELEIKISELRLRAEAMVQRGREELEVELEIKDYSSDETEVLMGALREELRQIKGRIKMLGTVNLLAYEEWKEESERFAFLKGQSDDLRNAEKTLLETIDEINTTAQTKFMETFEEIRKNFVDIFTSLFAEGDEADLKIEEGDPLEAQVEIIAKPRGKRPHTIDLLSGGEKTLTAIALLFAIYLVKPSPFCILDEVDAPLDDANIDRFVQLVRRFSKETQFIIVTHNKRTMSAADTMYGVTQEEDGVSKIVSVRFTESAKRSAPPAQ
ncbi:MAG: chromosome segregation protein SMC [Candidatus Kapaibacterium sp.]